MLLGLSPTEEIIGMQRIDRKEQKLMKLQEEEDLMWGWDGRLDFPTRAWENSLAI